MATFLKCDLCAAEMPDQAKPLVAPRGTTAGFGRFKEREAFVSYEINWHSEGNSGPGFPDICEGCISDLATEIEDWLSRRTDTVARGVLRPDLKESVGLSAVIN